MEDLFKKSFEDFEAEVSPSVWSNIKTGLKGVGLGFIGKAIINKIGTNTIVAIVSSVATVIGTVGVMHWTGNAVKNTGTATNENKSAVTPVEKPSVSPIIDIDIKPESVKTDKPSTETIADNQKPATTIVPVEQKMQETKVVIQPFSKDKKKIQSVINAFSGEPVASIFASPIGGTVPLIVTLSNTGKGTVNRWKYNDGKKEDKGANPVHVFENPGIYTVVLTSTDAEGKTQIDSAKIEVTGNSSLSAVPRELTPNGDGLNDVFTFNGNNIVRMTGQVFDMKGNVVFECDKAGGRWDGTNKKGKDAEEGVYIYIQTAEGKDGKKYESKGRISLIR